MTEISSSRMNYHTLSFKGRYRCHRLFSRLVWQVLFDEYRNTGGDLSRVDNMLCDYYDIEKRFTEYGETYDERGFRFSWAFGKWLTELHGEPSMIFYDDWIDVEFDPEKDEVRFYRCSTKG